MLNISVVALFKYVKTFLGRIFHASVKNLQNAPMLIRWSWYDWIILAAFVLIGPISLLLIPVWIGMKLSIGEDLRNLFSSEKAFHYYRQEVDRLRYQVSVLKKLKSVTDAKPTQKSTESDDKSIYN